MAFSASNQAAIVSAAQAELRKLAAAINSGASIEAIKSLIGTYQQCFVVGQFRLPESHVAAELKPLFIAVACATATCANSDAVQDILTAFAFFMVDFLKAAAELPRINLEVLRTLLDCAEYCMRRPIVDNNCAIHYAAMHCDCVAAIQMWIAAHPEGLMCKNSQDELPLHRAAAHNKNADVVRALCSAYPQALRVANEQGRIPLSLAASSPPSGDVVLLLLKAYPEGACFESGEAKSGELPLHHAIASNIHAQAICALISAYPEAVGLHYCSKKDLPIHRAARQCDSVDVMRALIAAHPDGLLAHDDLGNLPVHCAAAFSAAADVMGELVATYRDGLTSWNRNGQLPIHCAAMSALSAEVLRVLIDAYPESLTVRDRSGNLPLHLCAHTLMGERGQVRAFRELLAAYPQAVCAIDQSEMTVFEYRLPGALAALVKEYFPTAAFDERNYDVCPLTLHKAAIFGSAKLVRAMLRLDVHRRDLAVRDLMGRLPIHHAAILRMGDTELATLLLDAFPYGACVKDDSGHKPLQHAVLRNTTEVALLFLHRNPELTSRVKPRHKGFNDLWRAFAKSFTPSQVGITNFNIHICGEPFAGKSVVFHWISDILKQNRSVAARMGDVLHTTRFEIKSDDRRATRGTVTESIPYVTKNNRSLNCILRDYGGQAQFKLTHAPLLSSPASIYSIVLPLFDRRTAPPAQGKWFTVEELADQLKAWLRMIYSVICIDHVDNGDVDENDPDRITTVELPCYTSVSVPILVVINKFSAFRNPSKQPVTLLCIQQMVADMKKYFTDSSDGEVKEVFRFFDPVMIDACHKKDVYKLEGQLIQASELVAASQRYTRFHCVDFVLDHLPTWSGLLVLEPDVLRELAKIFIKHNYQQFATMKSTDPPIAEYLEAESPAQRLAEICLQTLIEMNHFMVLNTGFQQVGSRIIVTDPNRLTSEIVGEVLHETAERSTKGIHGQVPLVYSREELDAMVPNLPPGITVGTVLETLGLAMPVTIGSSNEILPVTSVADSVVFLLGLVEETMPSLVVQECQRLSGSAVSNTTSSRDLHTALNTAEHSGDMLVRSASRLFSLENNRCCFIPGFFMKLFMFIHNNNPCPERSWYWKDGMVMRSIVRWKIKNRNDMEGRKLISIYPCNDRGHEGFVVTISLWMNAANQQSQIPMRKWDGFFHPHDVVLDELDKIRAFIFSTEHWKISVNEFILQGESIPPMLASHAEAAWFAGEKSRMRIRPALIGHFSDYNSFIKLESMFNLLLISSSAMSKQQQHKCAWSGLLSELISALRAKLTDGIISEKDLVVWIVRYYRSCALKLSAGRCDSIVRKIMSEDAVGSALDYDSDDEPEDLTDSETMLHALHNAANQLLEGQKQALARYVEDSRNVHKYPLLAVMSRYQPSTVFGRCRTSIIGTVGMSTYRVHFHCSVCGCRSPTAGKGYKLNLGTAATETVLQIFQISLSFLEVMLQLGGVPNQISIIADLAASSLDILATDLRSDLLKVMEEEEVENQKDMFNSKRLPGTTPSTTETPSVLLDASKKVLRSEKVITKKHIDSMEKLFKEHFDDPRAENSGLEKAIRDNGESAWVCGAEDGTKKSCCYEEFMNKGHDCIAVLAKYE